MFDSLPYRNDAAIVFRRLIRSLPTRRGVLGVATCDKGLPAMMMALAGTRDLPVVLVPGGVTLPPTVGEDAGAVQTLGARFSHGLISLDEAADLGCKACGTPGGGCQFLGTAATSQVVGEALGLSLRLGRNTTNCYSLARPQAKQLEVTQPHDPLAWPDEGFGGCGPRTQETGHNDFRDYAAQSRLGNAECSRTVPAQ